MQSRVPDRLMFFKANNTDVLVSAETFHRIVYIKKGSIFIENREKKIRLRSPGLIFITAGAQVKTFSIQKDGPLRCQSLFLSTDILDQIILSCWKNKFLQDSITRFWKIQNRDLPMYLELENSETTERIFSRIEIEIYRKQAAYENMVTQYLMQLFIHLFRQSKYPGRTEGNALIDQVIDYLNRNYTETISLKDLSEKYNINGAYLSSRFKKKTGMALFEYINHIRIQKTCLLLKRSRQSIIEIAYSVGYNNISFFNRYFRKIMQMSPREYRNSIQK